MKNILIALFLIVMFSACTSYTCPTYAQKKESKNIEFNYFRIATIEPNQSLAMDFNGRIWITKEWLVIKSDSYSVLDKRFNFRSEVKVKGVKAWNANPEGEPYVKVYIEYSKDEYIIVFFVKNNVVTYFISEEIKGQFQPMQKYATWYKKLN